MSLTGPAALPPSLTARTGFADTSPVVVEILAALASSLVSDVLAEGLAAAGGAGSILSGIVSELSPDGTFILNTTQGTQLTLRQPRDVDLALGSTVAVRITTLSPTAQAVILAVDGKPVRAQTGSEPAPAASPTTQPPAPLGYGGTLSTLAASTLAELSLAKGQAGASAAAGDPEASLQAVMATLVRSGPARRGIAQPPSGTRYRVEIAIPGAEDLVPAEPETVEPGSNMSPEIAPPDPASQGFAALDPSIPALAEPADFAALTASLEGTVVGLAPNLQGATLLVDTPIGTLALALPPGIAAAWFRTGAPIRIEITHVAAPGQASAPDEAGFSTSADSPSATRPAIASIPAEIAEQPSLLEEAAAALGAHSRDAAGLIQALSVPAGARLAAQLYQWFGAKPREAARAWPDPDIRSGLEAAGRADLALRLDREAGPIGSSSVAADPRWTITTLPFIGTGATAPARLYRKRRDDAGPVQAVSAGERFVIEIDLKRLGPFQFDGFVRDRHFELVLRTRSPLDPELGAGIRGIFYSALGLAGFAGEIGFARVTRFPFASFAAATGDAAAGHRFEA